MFSNRSLLLKRLSGGGGGKRCVGVWAPYFCISRPRPTEPQQKDRQQQQYVRNFHASEKREILPLIGVAAIVIIGRYSWKALKRMDDEWEDYQWELQQYEKQVARNGSPSDDENSSKPVAIDLGSIYTKIAMTHKDVIISREGDRSIFNGIVYDDNNDQPYLRGRAALERFYYRPFSENAEWYEEQQVKLPWWVTTHRSTSEDASKVLSDSIKPALVEALERSDIKMDEQQLRKVVTVPTAQMAQMKKDSYKNAFCNVLPEHPTTFLPEPVAAVWGAQARGLLPQDSSPTEKKKVLVIDVGGMTTQLTIVKKNLVVHSAGIPWGGETFVRIVVELLLKESPTPLNDPVSLAAIQTQARRAVPELASKTRVSIHVPYIYAGGDSGHHLDTTVSRTVVEQALNDNVLELRRAVEKDQVLSPHMPEPTDLLMLWTSIITQVLEQSQQLPSDVNHVLLVGAGSKAPIVTETIRSALHNVMGADASAKLIVPERDLLGELTVLGAATILPQYEYCAEGGLHRVER